MILVEIDKSCYIAAASCWRTPVWHFPVYETGGFFDWFAEGSLGRGIQKIGTVVINAISYANAGAIDPAALEPGFFCQIGNAVYFRNENDSPAWRHHKPKYGLAHGFTDGPGTVLDGVYYKSGLQYVPDISDKADNLEYGAMAFKNDTLKLVNAKGEYDDTAALFGNNARVKMIVNGAVKELYEYYIKNVKISARETAFSCGDRREKLRQKVPNGTFTQEEYPKINQDLAGEFRQDAYGQCEWVKCVCVDELDIYAGEADEEGQPAKKQYRTFYVSRTITELKLADDRNPEDVKTHVNYVWIKTTQPDAEAGSKEVWTPCPVNAGIDRTPIWGVSITGTIIKMPIPVIVGWELSPILPEEEHRALMEKGMFILHIGYCMPSGAWDGYEVPELFEVRACGAFNPQNTPGEIIKELLRFYCGIPYNGIAFNAAEFEAELDDLKEVGIVYDKEASVFEAVEALQNSIDCGFQFKTDYNRFTARRDDNSRPPADAIRLIDIVDIEQVEIDMNYGNYATIINVPYSRNCYTGNAPIYEGKKNRDNLIAVYDIDRVYTAESHLTSREDAEKKAERLERFFCKPRAEITGLAVIGHPDLRVYDIVTVDLRIPIERKQELKHISALFASQEQESVIFGDWPGRHSMLDFAEEPQLEFRMFGGILKCKVMGVKLDLETMVSTLDLLEVG